MTNHPNRNKRHLFIGRRDTNGAGSEAILLHTSLSAAKRAVTKEFGDGYLDHTLVVLEAVQGPDGNLYPGDVVASKRIGDDRWPT